MPVPIKLEPIGPEPMSTSRSTTTAASAPTSCLFRGGAAKLLLDSPFPSSEIRPPPFASAGRAASATPSFGAPAQTPSTTPIGGRWPSSSAQPSEARSSLFPVSKPPGASLFPVGKPSGASMFVLPGVSVSQDKAQEKEKHGGQSERYSHTHIPNFGTKVVTVRVGLQPDHTDFTVHENLLSRTPFFADALNRRNTFTAYIAIGGQQASTFGIYMNWLYTGRLHNKRPKATSVGSHSPHHDEWLSLTDACLLGEYLGDADFRDTVIDAKLEWFHVTPSKERRAILDTAAEVYRKVQTGDPLRRFISDIAAYHFDDKTIQEIVAKHAGMQLPALFVADILGKLSSRFHGPSAPNFSNVPRPPVIAGRGTCNYHCHGDKECYKKK